MVTAALRSRTENKADQIGQACDLRFFPAGGVLDTLVPLSLSLPGLLNRFFISGGDAAWL